jgi:TonB family protein
MFSARTLLSAFLGTFLVIAGLAAQEVRDTIGPIEKQAKPITPENPIPRRTFSAAPVYPADAQGIQASGTVSLAATIDETGRVVEIRKVREPIVFSPTAAANSTAVRIAADGMMREAAATLRRWTYDAPASGPISFLVTFSFRPGAETSNAQSASVPGVLTGAAGAAALAGAAKGQPIRVGGSVRAPTQISKVQPVYPAVAQSARVSGVVILEAVIGVDGRVTDATVLRSIPLLDQAAVDAVKQWVYTPTLLNGVPVPIIMTVTVTFALPPPPPRAAAATVGLRANGLRAGPGIRQR